MSSPDRNDIERSLADEMTDEEAVEIMEGRVPTSERPDIQSGALAIARRLLAEEVGALSEQPSTEPIAFERTGDRSSSVVELVKRQPWMRMAAALLLGVAVTTGVNVELQPTGAKGTPSTTVASTNVIYLESTRGADVSDVPPVTLGAEPWVSLLVYPDFGNADLLHVYVERAIGQGPGPEGWSLVLEETTGAGLQDAMVVNVPAALLRPGLHRLRIETERDAQKVGSMSLPFRVEAEQ